VLARTLTDFVGIEIDKRVQHGIEALDLADVRLGQFKN
jgi:hypothetical protein